MIPGILPGEVLQWYLICTLVNLIFIFFGQFIYHTSGAMLGMTT